MSTSPSLETILHLVGPRILPFLSFQDIFCSLQYASTEIRGHCINSRETWRKFVHKYCFGPNLRKSAVDRLVVPPGTIVCSVTDIPSAILYTMITSSLRKTDLKMDFCDVFVYENTAAPPEKPVEVFGHMRLFWTGRWGVFSRMKFSPNIFDEDDPYSFEAAAEVLIKRQTRQDLFHRTPKTEWRDFMLGTIEARNVCQGSVQQRFQRLEKSVTFEVTICNYENFAAKNYDVLSFVYLWPLEDWNDRSTSELIVETDSKNPESKTELRCTGDVGVVRNAMPDIYLRV